MESIAERHTQESNPATRLRQNPFEPPMTKLFGSRPKSVPRTAFAEQDLKHSSHKLSSIGCLISSIWLHSSKETVRVDKMGLFGWQLLSVRKCEDLIPRREVLDGELGS